MNYRELTVGQHWATAQYWLAEYTGGHSYDVPYGIFSWKFEDNAIHIEQEGSIMFVLGHFDPVRMEITISLPFVPAHVIEHEACHAILFVLGDDNWVEYCHAPARPWFNLAGEND
jgi:hypothetical protein